MSVAYFIENDGKLKMVFFMLSKRQVMITKHQIKKRKKEKKEKTRNLRKIFLVYVPLIV